MKKLFFMALCVILYTSCASSQNSAITQEAQKKVDNMKTIINLTEEQAKKMVGIETSFLKDSKKLSYSSTYTSKLKALQEKRISEIKQVLTREQYVKFDLIENNRIKKVPIRAN